MKGSTYAESLKINERIVVIRHYEDHLELVYEDQGLNRVYPESFDDGARSTDEIKEDLITQFSSDYPLIGRLEKDAPVDNGMVFSFTAEAPQGGPCCCGPMGSTASPQEKGEDKSPSDNSALFDLEAEKIKSATQVFIHGSQQEMAGPISKGLYESACQYLTKTFKE